jgi:hypothetical protein
VALLEARHLLKSYRHRVVVDRVSQPLAVVFGMGTDGRLPDVDLAPPLASKSPDQLVADPRWSPAWGTRVVLRRP